MIINGQRVCQQAGIELKVLHGGADAKGDVGFDSA
jgi:hypothetical protein